MLLVFSGFASRSPPLFNPFERIRPSDPFPRTFSAGSFESIPMKRRTVFIYVRLLVKTAAERRGGKAEIRREVGAKTRDRVSREDEGDPVECRAQCVPLACPSPFLFLDRFPLLSRDLLPSLFYILRSFLRLLRLSSSPFILAVFRPLW